MPKASPDAFETELIRVSLRKILENLANVLAPFGEVHGSILDSKCDLIDADGPNPMHFPSLETCAKAARQYIALKIGDTVITNDPYSGNTRQCDLFLLQGAFGKQQANELRYHVALQLSLPALLNKNISRLFTSVEDEGFRIPPTLLDQGGSVNAEIVQYLSQSGMPKNDLTRALDAAKAALKEASAALIALEQNMGRDKFVVALDELKKYSETIMRRALHEIPDGDYLANDVIENDGIDGQSLRVQCQLTVHGANVLLSFMGTVKQTKGPLNCNYSMTLGACFWVLRSLVKGPLPINKGAFQAFSVEAPDGTLVNARYPSALLGGYFETSKRIVDVLYLVLNKALPALVPSQNGGSSNVSLMRFGEKFFLDTLGSGGGATKGVAGTDCVKADLHNSVCLSIEELEQKFPLQVTHQGIRDVSGGDGKNYGGHGLTRGYKFLAPANVMLLSDRRTSKARGLFGGVSGLNGEYLIVRDSEKKKVLGEKKALEFSAGDTLIINTPGGGGWGKKEEVE